MQHVEYLKASGIKLLFSNESDTTGIDFRVYNPGETYGILVRVHWSQIKIVNF